MAKRWMLVISVLTVIAWVVLSSASSLQDAKALIGNAMKALNCENLKSIEFSGSGSDFVLGQAPNPTSPWPRFIDKTYTRVINFETPASRMQRARTQGENPPRGGGLQPVIGERMETQLITPGSPQAAGLQDDLAMSLPYGFLRAAAAANDATVKSQKMGGKNYTVLTFTASNRAPMSGYFNEQNILEKVETKIDNNVLGDIPFETAFMDYKDFNGVKFPTHIVQKQGSYPVLDLNVSDVKPNAPANIQNPPGKGGAAGGGGPQTATSEKLGDGVYLILGNYAAVVEDFKDYIVVIEGGLSDQRSAAVMAEAKRLIPNKPIKYVVNTHHHFDHSGGLRAYVAEGATVVTQEINKPYYEKIWANPHTLSPDRLAQNPKKATFKTVKDKMVLTDGNHVIELYHLQNFDHNDGMLIAYLPKEKVLIEADGFNPPVQLATQPPAQLSPYTASLMANIERLKLDVERIIPIHYPADNRKVMFAELKMAVGKGA